MAAIPTVDTLQPVELADGVEIHLRVAGPAARSSAWLIDTLIFLGIMLALSFAVGLLAHGLGPQVMQGIMLLILFFLMWFYNVFFEMTKHAATPGQRYMKLKVTSVSGAPVRLPQSIIRNLLRVIDFMPGFYLFGFICCLFTRRFQRLGDLVADTVVIYTEPAPDKTSPVQPLNVHPQPPPQPLLREEQAAFLQFIERSPHWSDERRRELSDLLEPLTHKTGYAGLNQTCSIGMWLQKGGQE
jgi:uncharacterized RDD family membrane protein YckC